MAHAVEDGATQHARGPAHRCLVCGLTAEPTGRFHPTRLERCPDCGLLFRAVSQADDASMYSDDSYSRERLVALTHDRRDDAEKRAHWTRAHTSGGRLLDVGAGAGFFVEMAAKHGFEASGVEPSNLAAEYARRELGVDVRTGFLDSTGVVFGTFDVISMWHVLEHATDPVALLNSVRTRLRTGGRLVLEVPNIDSVGAELMKGRWAHLDPAAHVCHFSPRSLRIALQTAGFQVLHVSTLIEGYYDTEARRRHPRRVAGRLIRRARLRTRGFAHPSRGELLRVVATA